MKGIIIVNQTIGHNQYKIERFKTEFQKKCVDLEVFVNDGTLAEIKNNEISHIDNIVSFLWSHLRYNLVQKAAVQVTVQAFLQIREKFTMFSGQIQEASSSQISMGYSSPPVPSRSSLVPLLLLFSGDSSLMDAFLLGISLTTAVDDVTRLTSPRKSFHCRNLGGFQATERFYFLLNSIGDSFLDPSRPHDCRIRVGIIRHGHSS